MNVYTLTLSPAYDVHAICEDFSAGKENLALLISREAGGKGINISRALLTMGIQSIPVVLLGNENSAEYEAELSKSGLSPRIIRTEGRIRENLTLHHGEGETRISYKGFDAPRDLVDKLREMIHPAPCDVLTLTGRLPEDITPNDLLPYLKELRDKGVRIVVDSRSYTADDLKALMPWLIKPNREEIEGYIDQKIDTLEELVRYADEVAELSGRYALVTFDSEGAALIQQDGTKILHAPKLNVVSTIGAGDAAIAGFIYARAYGKSVCEALGHAVAFGCAATLTDGTAPPRRDDINMILNNLI